MGFVGPSAQAKEESYSIASLSQKAKAFEKHRLFPHKELTPDKKDHIARFWDKTEKYYTPDIFDKTAEREPRTIGNMIADLAIVNWAIDSERSRTVMSDWVERAIRIDTWGNNHDLEISHLLFGLALVYDWHRESLDPELRARLKKFLFERARFQFDQTQLRVTAWWSNSYWQNHFWVNYTSILASGLALAKEQPEGMYWAQTAYAHIVTSLELFSQEGSNHEGLNYSLYGNQWLVRAMSLLEPYDTNIFRRSDYLKNYHRYFQAYSVDQEFHTFFDTGDSPRFLWDFSLSEIFLKLYQAYQVPIYKDLYFYFLNVPSKAKPGILWCVYGALDPKLDDRTVRFDKKAYFSADLGIFTEKQYDADQVKTSFLFKSGIPGGRTAHAHMRSGKDYRLNLSHSHPDQNHLMIWTKDGFLLSDTGYTQKKWTIDQNSLVINGDGQLGEGSQWFREKDITGRDFPDDVGLTADRVVVTDEVTAVSAEALMFYPKLSGLAGFERTVLWIKEAGFLIIDKIAVNSPSNIERPFHSDFNFVAKEAGGYELQKNGATVGYFKNLYPEIPDAVVRKEPAEFKSAKYGKEGDRLVLTHRLQKKGVALCFVSVTDEPIQVQSDEKGLKVEIVGRKTYRVYINVDTVLTAGSLTGDAAWAMSSSHSPTSTDAEWLFYRAKEVSDGKKTIWSGDKSKNLRFHLNTASAGLLPQVEEI